MAPRSLSLSAYLALTRRGNGQPVYATEAERPAGELIWGHASNIDHAHALVQLAARLAQMRPDLTLLLTTLMDVLRLAIIECVWRLESYSVIF